MWESQSTHDASADLRIKRTRRGAAIQFRFDGRPIDAYVGETVAAALLAAGCRVLRSSARLGEPRGAFCFMGLCQECTVVVDGVRQPACRLDVRDGLSISSGTVP